MRNDSKLMKEIFSEIKETNRLIGEMNRSLQQLMKCLLPQKHGSETIQRGGGIAEITVRTPEKLDEWRSLFERRGMRVEYYEPFQKDGEEYFAKIWGYLDKHKQGNNGNESAPELSRHLFLSQEKHS